MNSYHDQRRNLAAYRPRNAQAEEARTENVHAQVTGERDDFRRTRQGWLTTDDAPTMREVEGDR